MKRNQELTLDSNGVPILTEIVSSVRRPGQKTLVERLPGMSIDEISKELLANPDFTRQLEIIASTIAAQTRQQVAAELEIAIQDAINKAVAAETSKTQNEVSAKIAAALPAMLSRILSQGSK